MNKEERKAQYEHKHFIDSEMKKEASPQLGSR